MNIAVNWVKMFPLSPPPPTNQNWKYWYILFCVMADSFIWLKFPHYLHKQTLEVWHQKVVSRSSWLCPRVTPCPQPAWLHHMVHNHPGYTTWCTSVVLSLEGGAMAKIIKVVILEAIGLEKFFNQQLWISISADLFKQKGSLIHTMSLMPPNVQL